MCVQCDHRAAAAESLAHDQIRRRDHAVRVDIGFWHDIGFDFDAKSLE